MSKLLEGRVTGKGPRTYVRPVEAGVPYGLVVLTLVAGFFAVPGFLTGGHVASMVQTASYIGIIAIGQTFVLLLGGIDLSISYMLNFAAVLLTGLEASHIAGGLDLAVVLGVGLAAGLINGLGVALLDISPLVMTLGMNSVLQGVTLVYTNGSPRGNAPGFVSALATGRAGIPYVVILWIVLALVVTGAFVFTTFGRSIYSIGSNRAASELCALPVKRTVIAAYTISALSATVGGILLAGYSGQAYLGMGDNYLLPSIAVVVIGGTSIYGGKGSYVQTVAGALMITFLESALVTIKIGQAGQDILYGALILLMAALNEAALQVEGHGRTGAVFEAFRGWLQPVRSRALSPPSGANAGPAAVMKEGRVR